MRRDKPSILAAVRWLALALIAGPAVASDPLPPAEVFRYTLHDAGDAIEVRWDIEPGYYLYKQKLGFRSLSDGVTLGAVELPAGLPYEDEYFGAQEIYRDGFVARLPYNGSGSANVEIRSQGCADIGLCYPPQTWTGTVVLAASGTAPLAAAAPASGSLLANAGNSGEVLPPDAVFRPALTLLDGRTLEIAWQIEPGHYLYRDKVDIEPLTDGVSIERLDLPTGKNKYDEYFGDTEVYYDGVIGTARLTFDTTPPAVGHFALSYQGCAEDTICYPPLERYASVDFATLTASVLPPDADSPAPAVAASATTTAATAAPARESRQDMLARKIRDGNLAVVMGLFFALGLGLALTPCVLPMIPILSGIIAGDGEETTPRRAFLLSLAYVLGMALTYTIAGAGFALAGQQAQAVFQQPWILILFAGLFVALALSMFGAYELQVPSAIQSRLAAVSGRQKSGTFVGAFVMGALSALIVTACVAPPLVATLAVIGQTGDVVRGALALFSLSMGMGAPLLLVGASAGQLLPKAGAWMVAVKGAFGFIMLGLAIYVLERLLPGPVVLAAYAVLVFMAGIFLGAMTPLTPDAPARIKIGKGFGVLAAFYGAVMLFGALTGGKDPLRPVDLTTIAAGAAAGNGATHEVQFQRVKTVAELDAIVASAAARGQPVMLDFYADWCVSCKEMEKYTFTDPAVKEALKPAVLLQADVTANDADDRAMLERFGLFGPPGIIFFSADGQRRQNYTVVGMMWPDEFAPHVIEAFGEPPRTAAR